MNVSGPGLVSCFILGSCLILEIAEIISITVSKLSNYISTELSPPPPGGLCSWPTFPWSALCLGKFVGDRKLHQRTVRLR